MKINFKKAAACAAALSMTCSLCGCMDNGYLMTVEGMNIRNGIYISFMRTSLNNAQVKLGEIENDNSSGTDSEPDNSENENAESTESTEGTESTESSEDNFDKTIEGESYSDWVKNDTLKSIKRYVGIIKTCEDKGIELSDDEIKEISDGINEDWELSGMYVTYLYGTETLGEYYETLGIGKDSMKEINKANMLNNKLFNFYYGEGGEKEVPDEEYETYVNENYAACRLIKLDLTDYKGSKLESDSDKKAVRDRAKEYADRINKGENMVDVKYDEDLRAAQDKARSDAEDNYDEENADGLSKDEYIEKMVGEAAATKAESDSTLDQAISRSDTSYSDSFKDFVLSAEDSDNAIVFDDDDASYVIIKNSVFTLENWNESNYSNVIHEMKTDEFNLMMEDMFADYEVDLNSYLVNSKYTPEKLDKKINQITEDAQKNFQM